MNHSTWAIPLAIGLLGLVGLIAALTGDGWRDALGWTGLAMPLAATCWAFCRRT